MAPSQVAASSCCGGPDMMHKIDKPSMATAKPRWPLHHRVLIGLQGGAVVLALVFCLQGRGQPLVWLSMGFVLPILSFLLVRTYRESVLRGVSQLWIALQD